MLKIIFLSLFSSLALAQDCPGLKDGEVLRLDDKNGTLQNFKAQDQDGMGTCYANSASVLLQSTLKNSPDISYLHLASLFQKEKFDKGRSQAGPQGYFNIYTSFDDRLAISGGDICSPINAIKQLQQKENRAFLCQKKDVTLEKLLSQADESSQQNRTLLGPAAYMNVFQRQFSGIYKPTPFLGLSERAEADEIYHAFTKSLNNLINRKQEQFSNVCKTETPYSHSDIFEPLTGYFDTYMSCFKKNEKKKTGCDILHSLVLNPKEDNRSIRHDGINPSLSKRLSEKLELHKGELSESDVKDMITDVLVLETSKNFTDLNKSKYQDEIHNLLKKMPTKIFAKFAQERNDIRQKGFSDLCIDRALFIYLSSSEFVSDASTDQDLCRYRHLTTLIPGVALGFKDTGINDFKQVVDFITYGARLTYDDFFHRYFAQTCVEENKIKIPESISCVEVRVNDKNKTETNQLLIKSLKNNRAVGVSICSFIYDNPFSSRMTRFDKGCGPHAVAAIGMRCDKGEYGYLVQNSWGTEHNPENPEIKKDEKANGASWFNEKAFASSVFGVSILEGSN